jgi:hypothetical protein
LDLDWADVDPALRPVHRNPGGEHRQQHEKGCAIDPAQVTLPALIIHQGKRCRQKEARNEPHSLIDSVVLLIVRIRDVDGEDPDPA